jgi:hypothetical protein
LYVKSEKNVVQNKSNLILKNFKEIIYNYNFVIGRGHLDNMAFRIFGMENPHIKWHTAFLKGLAETFPKLSYYLECHMASSKSHIA